MAPITLIYAKDVEDTKMYIEVVDVIVMLMYLNENETAQKLRDELNKLD